MTIANWNPQNFNSKFFNLSYKVKDNAITTQYLSGRVSGYQANTKKLKTISCMIEFTRGTELEAFWTWYNDALGQTAGVFTCSALGSGHYRFTQTPEPQDTDLNKTVLQLSIEEV